MKITLGVLASLFCGSAAIAQQAPAVSFGASTLGATLEAGYRIGPNFGLRGIAGLGRAQFDSDFNGAPVSGTANIGGIGLLGDVYFGGGGRLTAGGLAPNYNADLSITGDITVEGSTFNNVNIRGRITSEMQFAPVLAIGYEKSFGQHWGISADLGAMYMGGFALSATDTTAQIPQVDLDSELASTNAELGQISVLPFAKISVSFAF